MTIGSATAAVSTPDLGTKPKSVQEAASAFEALFIGNLLKTAREAGQGGLSGDTDQAGGTMVEVAEEYLANAIAKGGGCGLAKVVIKQFAATHPAHSE